jgi:hypothetical protein
MGITENISENEVSPIGDIQRRGRPVVMSAEEEATYQHLGLFDGKNSRRSKLDVHYRQRALGILKDDPAAYVWLFNEEAIMREGGSKHWQPAILTQLGRIADEDTLLTIARQICELKPTTSKAVAMIRRFRVGGLPAPDALQLANVIIHAVNGYLRGHAPMEKADVLSALSTASELVDKSLEA